MQHYGLNRGRFFRLYCGHCALYTRKKKQPDSKICEHFQAASDPEEELVCKEYLYKELLKHVLSLELAPEIENSPAGREGRG